MDNEEILMAIARLLNGPQACVFKHEDFCCICVSPPGVYLTCCGQMLIFYSAINSYELIAINLAGPRNNLTRQYLRDQVKIAKEKESIYREQLCALARTKARSKARSMSVSLNHNITAKVDV